MAADVEFLGRRRGHSAHAQQRRIAILPKNVRISELAGFYLHIGHFRDVQMSIPIPHVIGRSDSRQSIPLVARMQDFIVYQEMVAMVVG